MSFPAAKSRITIQEYLDGEASARDKHECHDGEIRMRAGGTYRHSKVILNAGAAIDARLEGHACQASESNTRVAVQKRSTYVYPDLTVICGEPEFDPLDKRGTTITNPAVVVEVLSETTEAYDRGAKFDLYRDLPTLREYVIISTSEAAVESFLRQPDGEWIFSYAKGLSASIRLRSLGLSVPLSEIYDRISFDAAGNRPEASP